MAESKLITVGVYTQLPEAELAQGILDDAGIESVLVDDNVGRMLTWVVVGGFKVQVNDDDAEAAHKLLSTATPGQAEHPGTQPPCCPNCGSTNVVSEESDAPAAYTGASLLTPVPGREKSWKCQSCGSGGSE